MKACMNLILPHKESKLVKHPSGSQTFGSTISLHAHLTALAPAPASRVPPALALSSTMGALALSLASGAPPAPAPASGAPHHVIIH
jgi:hypothetical protein